MTPAATERGASASTASERCASASTARRCAALEGDTIGSALFAAGRRTFSRSFKYHRPRGLLCCAGQCPNCLVQVDDAPGVRACTEPVREGMRVEHMNATPVARLRRDARHRHGRRAVHAARLLLQDLHPAAAPVAAVREGAAPRRRARAAAQEPARARVADRVPPPPRRRARRRRRRRRPLAPRPQRPSWAPTWCSATRAPSRAGVCSPRAATSTPASSLARAREAGVEVLSSAPALGAFDGLVPVWQGDTLHQVRAGRHRLRHRLDRAAAAVRRQRPARRDAVRRRPPPGRAVRACAPGSRAVVATVCDRGLDAALALADAGVEIVAVADLRANAGIAAARGARRAAAYRSCAGRPCSRHAGGGHVQRAILGTPGADGGERDVDCDLLVVSGGSAPATSLLSQAGARTAYDAERGWFALADVPDGVHAAGEVAGAGELEHAELSGSDRRRRGRARARLRRAPGAAHSGPERRARPAAGGRRCRPAVTSERGGKCFACLCEDVTVKDIHLSVEEGYDSIELSKRYTTTTMGPCQGRMCQLPAVRVMAQETGQSLAQVGTTTARPPWHAVPMGALAGRPFEPAKRSAIHGRHRELGANVMWAGDWRRAYDYGDARAEALAVHQTAGLIDVSTLGKLIVRGPDAGELLDRLYPNRFSNLKPGRIRYGVIASDAGRIIDDGTVCRLDDDSLLRHHHLQRRRRGLRVVLLVAGRLAPRRAPDRRHPGAVARSTSPGPRAREIMAQGDRPRLLERGVHLPRRQARRRGRRALPDPADRLRRRGRLRDPLPLGARRAPLGRAARGRRASTACGRSGSSRSACCASRRCTSSIGQDTDSESNPFGAAMPWIVKLDKEQDFIGKWALEHASEEPLGDRAGRLHARATATCPPRAPSCFRTAAAPSGRSRARASRPSSAA